MLGKRILAGIFALLILLKITLGVTIPGTWMELTGAFLGHPSLVIIIYLVLLGISGYVIFTSLDLIDVAVVMFFTSILMGLSLIPYWAAMLNIRDEIAAHGFGKAWIALAIWVALAVAVLYKIFVSKPAK